MKKGLLASIIAGVVFLALIIGGIFVFSQVKGNNQPYTPKNPTPSVSPSPTVEPTPVVTGTLPPDEKEIKSVKDTSGNFKDAKAVEFFTEAETKEALQTAYDYSRDSLSNKYFLSGEWAKDGFAIKEIDGAFGQYYSKELRAKINAWDDSNGGSKLKSEDLLPLVFYVADNGEVAPSASCVIDNKGTDEKPVTSTEPEVSCPLSGLTVSDMKYESIRTADGETPGIKVAFTASTEIPVTIKNGNKDAKTDVTYEYILVLVSNNYKEDTVNPKSFVIADYDTKLLASKVTPLNE
jgi:hypothetical protein